MPGSVRENDSDVRQFVVEQNIKSVLDIGAGKGTYSDLLRDLVDRIDGVEVWTPYISNFGLTYKYDIIHAIDARLLHPVDFEGYDLVIFGDVLEHMTKEEAVDVWWNSSTARYGLISVPIIHYPQGAEFGNPYEEHVQEHLTPDEIQEAFGPFIQTHLYPVTGTFIREWTKVPPIAPKSVRSPLWPSEGPFNRSRA